MALTPQGVTHGSGSGVIPSLQEQTVNIAQGLITSITDLDLNVYIGDDRNIYFGLDGDFNMGLSSQTEHLVFRNATDNTVFSICDDGTISLQELNYSTSDLWKGNIGMTPDGLYIKTEE